MKLANIKPGMLVCWYGINGVKRTVGNVLHVNTKGFVTVASVSAEWELHPSWLIRLVPKKKEYKLPPWEWFAEKTSEFERRNPMCWPWSGASYFENFMQSIGVERPKKEEK